ncbi:MAG: GntR family transcriptional regulator [Planctomycetes bacterium]|nr:GntR family transcriptional regulator [Planctomycetota bacterium]
MMMTLAEQAYEELRKHVLTGKYQMGEYLRQRPLAQQLGIATITLREVLQRLEKDGMIEIIPKWGAKVKIVDEKMLKEKFVIREAMECMAARLASQVATETEIEYLFQRANRVDGMEESDNPSRQEFVREHYDFHVAIAKVTHCEELVYEIERLNLFNVFWINAMLIDIGWCKGYPDWHKKIVEAIASRDLQKAENQMREHVQVGLKHCIQAITEKSDRMSIRQYVKVVNRFV